jgi:hypothetical protein
MKSLLPVGAVALLLAVLLTVASPSAAKKDLASHKVLTHLIPHLECSVCDAIIVKSYDKTQELFKASLEKYGTQDRGVKEEDIIEEVLEPLCNPRNKDGYWIRLLDIVVSPLDEQDTVRGVFVEPQDDYGVCKVECETIAATCNSILFSGAADDYSAYLYRNYTEKRLKQKLCKPLCNEKRMEKLIKKNPPQYKWDTEKPKVATQKELEVETMVDGLTQKAGQKGMPALDVFDKSEMNDLRGAMREGDYDTFTDLDPSGNDMSKEDFQAMSMMAQAMEMPEEETEEEKLKRESNEIRVNRAKEQEKKKREAAEAAEMEAERQKSEEEESSPFGALKKSLFG